MKEFNLICKEVESLNVLEYTAILEEKATKLIPALNAISEDEIQGTALFAAFILGSIVADNKIDESEYLLMYPLLSLFFGENIDYESCKLMARYFRKENKELKKYLDLVTDLLGLLSDELKEDLIVVCLLICAIDGKISLKEKRWIKQLIRE